jgi:hypothetical protein
MKATVVPNHIFEDAVTSLFQLLGILWWNFRFVA